MKNLRVFCPCDRCAPPASREPLVLGWEPKRKLSAEEKDRAADTLFDTLARAAIQAAPAQDVAAMALMRLAAVFAAAQDECSLPLLVMGFASYAADPGEGERLVRVLNAVEADHRAQAAPEPVSVDDAKRAMAKLPWLHARKAGE